MAQIIQPDNYGKLKIQMDADPRVTETLSEKVKNYGTAASGMGQLLEGQAKKKEVELMNASAEQIADDMVKMYGHPEFRQRYKIAALKNNLSALLGLQKEAQAENSQSVVDSVDGVTPPAATVPAPTNAITPAAPQEEGSQDAVQPADTTPTGTANPAATVPAPTNAIAPTASPAPQTTNNSKEIDPTKIEFGVESPKKPGPNTAKNLLDKYQNATPNQKKALDEAKRVELIKQTADAEKAVRENAKATSAEALRDEIVTSETKLKGLEQAKLNLEKTQNELEVDPQKKALLETQLETARVELNIKKEEYLKKSEPVLPTPEIRKEVLIALGESVADEYERNPTVRKVVGRLSSEFVNKITSAEDLQSRYDELMQKESPKETKVQPKQDDPWSFVKNLGLFGPKPAPTVKRGDVKLPRISGE